MFVRVLGVEENSKSMSASEMMSLLNSIFTEFDRLALKFQLEKIKTIGTCYMVVGGVPVSRENHLFDMAEMALKLRRMVNSFKSTRYPLDVQIGIHTGPCVAGYSLSNFNKFLLKSKVLLELRRLVSIFGATQSTLLLEWKLILNLGRYKSQRKQRVYSKIGLCCNFGVGLE
jgi:hypothetical protein